jgi:glutathione S-transferase
MHELPELTIVGRSGSHFTRIARMFARELGVAHAFRPIGDLLSFDATEYAGNPALKLPILEGPGGTRFGTLNICRELSRRAASQLRIVWPEDQLDPLSCNALELTLQGMATEVILIMQAVSGADQLPTRATGTNCAPASSRASDGSTRISMACSRRCPNNAI